jgi:hypothetical protein
MPHSSVRPFLALFLGLSSLAPAGATTYVMMSDEALVDSSPLIVEARVVATSGAPIEPPSTDYRVEILRVLKGGNPGAEIVVRRLGGVNAKGRAMKIWGLTRLAIGDRALLFLVPRPDGTYGVNQLILGLFREVEAEGRRVAVRDLDAATELRRDASGKLAGVAGGDCPRDAGGFSQWIVQRAQGLARKPDYFRDGLSLPKYNLIFDIACRDFLPLRRFDFDLGDSVGFRATSSGQPGLADGGFPEIQAALAAWTDDRGSIINYTYAGTTEIINTTNNTIVLDDPLGWLPGSYSSDGGGIVAMGSGAYSCEVDSYNGQQYHPIIDSYVVTQDGLACLFAGPDGVASAQEMFAHELGHTLGLADSGVAGALMTPVLHSPPIGATLSPDEVAAVGFLYGAPVPPPPVAPTNLQAAAASSTSIQLTWIDNASDEQSYVVEMRPTASGSYEPIAILLANATSYTATGLTPLTSYTFRVKARNGYGDSNDSNEAAATTLTAAPACTDPKALCLAGGRFSATATFDTTGGQHGTGQPVKLTADTGYFWFFAQTNVEVVIKVLDACAFTAQPAFWVFASGLTDVHVAITVTDLVSGQSHVYVNPIQAEFLPIQDTGTFQTCGAH